MKKKLKVIRVIGIIGLVLSMVLLYLGVKGIANVRPASDYEDMGVHSFVPYRVLPITVENTSTGRDKRLNPIKTVYVVYYKTLDGTGYQWEVETGNSKNDASKVLIASESIERRVLSVKEIEKYMTVEAELTADSYVKGQKQYYIWMVGLSVGYLVFCLAVWVIVKRSGRINDIKRQ